MNDNLEITKAKNGGFNVETSLHKDESSNTVEAEQNISSGKSATMKLVISSYIDKHGKDFRNFKFQRQKKNKKQAIWNDDGNPLILSNYGLNRIIELCKILEKIKEQYNISDNYSKLKLSLLDDDGIVDYLKKENSLDKIKNLIKNDDSILSSDIIAIGKRKNALQEFEGLLNNFAEYEKVYRVKYNFNIKGEEHLWQHFFENNKWIFGIAIEMRCLVSVNGDKLETVTTGFDHHTDGRRADGYMRTKAEISQTVLIEIKTPSDSLLQEDKKHKGCWHASDKLSAGVTQAQKTCRDYLQSRKGDIKVEQKDDNGNSKNDFIYLPQPKSFLVIGRYIDFKNNDDKIQCFELYRENLHSPQIITYDELYERAKFIVDNL